MANTWEKLAGASSLILRVSSFIFLRWIPGHHFPRMIVSALIAYLSIIFTKPNEFGSAPKLHELFPALFVRKQVIDPDKGEEIDVDVDVYFEEPMFYEDEHPFLKTLLCGIPDWREKDFSYVTIGLNILLTLLTLDLVFRGPILHPGDDLRFSRVGFVDSSSARILLREPDSSQLPIYTYYKRVDEIDWKQADKIYYLGPESDFTRPLHLTNLVPETQYAYYFSNDLNGTFWTAPAPGSPSSNSLTFLTSSCIKANFPYNPFSHSLAIHGFSHLSKLITSLPSVPAFMLFLGDFIYVDVPQRLSSTVAHYRSEYRRVYESPSWSLPGIESVPWLHTLDDHEIANDWSGGNETSPFPQASDPFIHYHVSVNPPIPPGASSSSETNTTYFQFTRGPASFFLLDTRRYRTNPESRASSNSSSTPLHGWSDQSPMNAPSTQDLSHPTILGVTQLNDLLRFLARPEPAGVHWKIIASSVPFTKNWRFGTPDTWGGFLHERSIVLDAMHRAEHSHNVRVVILSGDRHEFAAIRYPRRLSRSETPQEKHADFDNAETPTSFDPAPQAGPHEFSVGPLSMFYLPLRTFRQVDGQDVALAYFPDGNSKVGVVEIRNLAAGDVAVSKAKEGRGAGKGVGAGNGVQQRSWLRYSLYIDGKVAWEYMLTSPGFV